MFILKKLFAPKIGIFQHGTVCVLKRTLDNSRGRPKNNPKLSTADQQCVKLMPVRNKD